MRIGFVSRGTLRAFKEGNAPCDGERADLLLFGFDGVGEVSYEKELKGESDFFADVALLSKSGKNVVISGCITDTRGIKRKSAVVAEKGKLLGVSDMLHALDGDIGCGAALKIYDTEQGKMGVVVAEDLFFAENAEALSRCGCDFIVCPFGRVTDGLQSVLLRAYAFRCGLPVLLCAQGYCMLAEPTGELVFASPKSPVFFELKNRKEYHLVETRKRVCFPSQR
ncbi:MAG: carbon-nitrogen hydrolase family protein [Clostridia bacterium]|nr:carbon-nitrogen hydrolase family protein [Clostridia bacterium]